MMDINSDVGELRSMIDDGTQGALMPYLTSANIACGGHAGDEQTMRITVDQARRHRVAIGAHPGYPDRENFGRVELDMPLHAVEQTVFDQIRALAAIATDIVHVKPHGALYNQAVGNRQLAAAIARGVARYRRDVTLMGLAGSPMLEVFRQEGFSVLAEAFADRRYEADGTLRSRKYPDALIQDPAEAAAQALRMAEKGQAQTICIHSDTPGSVAIARAVSSALKGMKQ
jgi:5-oxoprolinase (ATP-hydrolysing) subunit A